MAGIKVIADNACDLPDNLVEDLGIGIVPLDVRLGEWGPEEMKLVSPGEFWRRCAMTGALAETSSPHLAPSRKASPKPPTKGARR